MEPLWLILTQQAQAIRDCMLVLSLTTPRAMKTLSGEHDAVAVVCL